MSTRPPPVPPPSAHEVPEPEVAAGDAGAARSIHLAGMCCAAGLALGAFFPWATLGRFSESGLDGPGWLMVGIAVLVLGTALLTRPQGTRLGALVTLALFGLALVISIVEITDVLDRDLRVGGGLWLTALASTIGAAGSAVALVVRR